MQPYAQVAETHSGLVVMVGDRAYKTKRPVVTDFLDFSTRERREAALRRELELNARLAPQAYLGIGTFDGVESGEGEPVLVMQRYPDETRLATRVRRGADGLPADLNAVAEILADFHTGAARGPRIDDAGRLCAVTARWDANIAELGAFTDDVVPAELVARIAELAHRYLAGRAVLFAERIADRRIVDGHADLLADDIFCGAGTPVLLDCLDFDDKLRFVDGLDDAACLAMDLEFPRPPRPGRRIPGPVLRARRRPGPGIVAALLHCLPGGDAGQGRLHPVPAGPRRGEGRRAGAPGARRGASAGRDGATGARRRRAGHRKDHAGSRAGRRRGCPGDLHRRRAARIAARRGH
jgi:aminoglycoside phosphotransferase family enzyme